MESETKNFVAGCIALAICGYALASLIAFFDGLSGATYYYQCGTTTRIEKVFPTYALGCWAGQPTGHRW